MNRIVRNVLAAVGLAALGFGVAVVADPALAGGVDATGVLVTFVGIVVGAFGLGGIQRRRNTPLRQAETGDPEDRASLPKPGDDVDHALSPAGTIGSRSRATDGGRTLRERVYPVAVEQLMARERCARPAAEQMLEEGSWTDDALAASFFTTVEEPTNRSLREQLRGLFDREPSNKERAIHAIFELAGDRAPDASTSSPLAGASERESEDDAARAAESNGEVTGDE